MQRFFIWIDRLPPGVTIIVHAGTGCKTLNRFNKKTMCISPAGSGVWLFSEEFAYPVL